MVSQSTQNCDTEARKSCYWTLAVSQGGKLERRQELADLRFRQVETGQLAVFRDQGRNGLDAGRSGTSEVGEILDLLEPDVGELGQKLRE